MLLAPRGEGLQEALPEGDQLSPGSPTVSEHTWLTCNSQASANSRALRKPEVGGGRPWAAAWEWKKSSGCGVPCHGTWPPGSTLPFSLVLYDACPKSLRSGVWWPQTKFGVLATVPCPRGALGEYVVCAAFLLTVGQVSFLVVAVSSFTKLGGRISVKSWE